MSTFLEQNWNDLKTESKDKVKRHKNRSDVVSRPKSCLQMKRCRRFTNFRVHLFHSYLYLRTNGCLSHQKERKETCLLTNQDPFLIFTNYAEKFLVCFDSRRQTNINSKSIFTSTLVSVCFRRILKLFPARTFYVFLQHLSMTETRHRKPSNCY